ncbi:MAG: permease [Acidobacteriota bacterium]|jgi:uncharacterized membrane protein YraQ (UPF0718 family)
MEIIRALVDILHHTAGMAWKIAWGLILGFGISGFVQAFVPRERVADLLGRFGLKPLALATGFGAASSSCSYAAAAMSKTLYKKGAHITNATAFLFASTNLVIEIGLVIWVLLGWRFVVAEVFGGVLLILLAALLIQTLVPRRIFERAKAHLESAESEGHHHHHGEGGTVPWSKVLTLQGWKAAGRYFATDWKMIGRDVVLGLLIAGSLAALVPREWWQTLFLAGGGEPGAGAGFWISLENALVGPVIAILSFVCSVGNIPLAAVLWNGGASFGGVIAFIFADLVTIPMILVYRRYYGWKPALAYAAVLLVTIIVVGLGIDLLFQWTGLTPPRPAGGGAIPKDYFAWDYTALLNLVFIPAGLWLFWLGSGRRGEGSHRGRS